MTETVWARAEMRRVLRAQSALFRCANARKAASRATARWIPRAQIARLGSTAARERCPARVPLRDGFSVRTAPVSDLLMSLRGRHALLARRCNTFPSVRRARSADANIHSAVHRQNLHLVFSLKHNHYSEPTTRQRRWAPAHQRADAPPCGTRQKQRSKRGSEINDQGSATSLHGTAALPSAGNPLRPRGAAPKAVGTRPRLKQKTKAMATRTCACPRLLHKVLLRTYGHGETSKVIGSDSDPKLLDPNIFGPKLLDPNLFDHHNA